MPEALANSTVALLVFGLVITALIVSVVGLESEQTRTYLRRQPWFRRFEQLGPSEIAEVLGITPNAVSIRLHRARGKFADALRKIDAEAGHEGLREGREA